MTSSASRTGRGDSWVEALGRDLQRQPPMTRRDLTPRRAAILGAVVMVVAACGDGGADQVHDVSTLPDHIAVCGRTWVKDSLARQSTLNEIRALTDVEPAVVGTGMFAPCPSGVCAQVARGGGCDTVVYVRVGEDAYVDYELSGGP